MGYAHGFIDTSSDHQYLAARKLPLNRANVLGLNARLADHRDLRALRHDGSLESGRQALDIAGDAFTIGAKQTGELDAPRILLQMLFNRLQPSLLGQ